MLESIIKRLFPATYSNIYFSGRYDGFKALEDLVFTRAEKEGPEAVKLVTDLMQ